MTIQEFKKIQGIYAKRENARLDERLNAGDTDTPYFQRVNEEMLVDIISRLGAVEASLLSIESVLGLKQE